MPARKVDRVVVEVWNSPVGPARERRSGLGSGNEVYSGNIAGPEGEKSSRKPWPGVMNDGGV